MKLYSPNGRVIDDLRSPDTFDTHLGERASGNVTPCNMIGWLKCGTYTCHPSSSEKTFEKVWGLLRVLLKNPYRLRTEKLLVCLVGLIQSFSKDPSGEKLFHWICCKLRDSCVSVKPWMLLVVQGISQRLLQASLHGTAFIYTDQF